MEARSIIYRGLNLKNGYSLLQHVVKEIERRKHNVQKSIRLFGHHSTLDQKLQFFKEIKEEKLWLLRESSKIPTFLTVDHVHFDRIKRTWLMMSHRLAFTNRGWQFVNEGDDPSTVDDCLPMNADLAELHRSSLLQYLEKYGFYFGMMIKSEVPVNSDEPVSYKIRDARNQ